MRVRTYLVMTLGLLLAAHAGAQLNCTRIYPVSPTQFGVYNNCEECMVVSLSWCDGSIRRVQVQAHQGVTLGNCFGSITLVGERPCRPASGKSMRMSLQEAPGSVRGQDWVGDSGRAGPAPAAC
jgi:hypothetical protein